MILSSMKDYSILVVMSDEMYNAMKIAYTMFGTYIKDTADKIGWDKAIEIRRLAGERNGKQQVKFYQTHDPETRLAEYGKNTVDYQNPIGWDIEYEATESELVFNIKVCPLFDGFLEAGIPVERINELCKVTHFAMDEELKKVFPDAEFTSVPKPSKEDYCIERVYLPP